MHRTRRVSVQASAAVWERSRLRGLARLVLLAIADAANREGENAFPSISTIAAMCLVDPRTVQRKILEAVAAGELEVVKGGGRRSNSYSILIMGPQSVLSLGAAPRQADTPVRMPPLTAAPPQQGQERHPSDGGAATRSSLDPFSNDQNRTGSRPVDNGAERERAPRARPCTHGRCRNLTFCSYEADEELPSRVGAA
jgi:Helix-turn-helix domain